ncbi:MAG: hypothetical protein EP298_09180 [Gammaproteobacteria bacterium]|nr:MAG: hypothetical protein EP298_09180 [Gammaproteobacteria bacterium]UTW42346.1 hypothetical protein KFE69_12805 [bacterium SCSIO 12844]
MKKKTLIATSVLSLAAASSSYADHCDMTKVNTAFQLMAERTELIKGVAANKYVTDGNVYAAAQEVKVLNGAKDYALAHGLNAGSFMLFNQMQIDVSKQIESYWISYWRNHPKDAPTKATIKSLTTLRSELVKLDGVLFPALQAAIESFKHCSNQQLQAAFDQQFSVVKGIPNKPSYGDMLLQSVKGIKLAH